MKGVIGFFKELLLARVQTFHRRLLQTLCLIESLVVSCTASPVWVYLLGANSYLDSFKEFFRPFQYMCYSMTKILNLSPGDKQRVLDARFQSGIPKSVVYTIHALTLLSFTWSFADIVFLVWSCKVPGGLEMWPCMVVIEYFVKTSNHVHAGRG